MIDGEGKGRTITVVNVEAEHPPALAVVTVYVPLCATVIDCDVVPLDHKYEAKPAPALSVTFPP